MQQFARGFAAKRVAPLNRDDRRQSDEPNTRAEIGPFEGQIELVQDERQGFGGGDFRRGRAGPEIVRDHLDARYSQTEPSADALHNIRGTIEIVPTNGRPLGSEPRGAGRIFSPVGHQFPLAESNQSSQSARDRGGRHDEAIARRRRGRIGGMRNFVDGRTQRPFARIDLDQLLGIDAAVEQNGNLAFAGQASKNRS